ncbi:MAG: hypothetical protein GF401_20245 [Chitinivibrionales bacterium]|nr:hypothetical protein [Chitinivibrionales bacterium]
MRFKRPDSDTVYTAHLREIGHDGSLYIFAVVSTKPDDIEIKPGDPAWIYEDAHVKDAIFNEQRNPDNRRVPLNEKKEPYSVTPYALNNPYNPDAITTDPQVQTFINYIKNLYSAQGAGTAPDNGVIIAVELSGQVRNVRLRGTVSIYDVVKNPIISAMWVRRLITTQVHRSA